VGTVLIHLLQQGWMFIADFIHSHLLPFSIASDAKLLQIIEIAKQFGQTYVVCIS
jgi:hypothetical protein